MSALAIAVRELRGALNQPLAYLLVGAFAALTAAYVFGLHPFFVQGRATLRPFFEFAPFVSTLFAPALAMRLIAEEQRTGQLELLRSWPLSTAALVGGKYLGALGLAALALIATLPVPLTVAALGPLDWGPVIGGYVGLFALIAAYLALGLLASALTSSQVVAYVLGFGLCFAFYLVGRAQPVLPAPWSGWAGAIGFEARFASAARGVLDTRDLAVFLAVAVVAIGLAIEAVDARRWR